MKILISAGILLIATSSIAFIFWNQEMQYALPTPIPVGYKPIFTGQFVNLPEKNVFSDNQPILLHFFNPDCPCSRFNIKEFMTMAEAYQDKISVYTIIPEDSDIERARRLTDNKFPVLVDTQGKFSSVCGVYATPQAVLLNKDHQIFYKGNYNISRYCTDKKTAFAAIALQRMLSGQTPPVFGKEATTAYGCPLSRKDL
jgi:hypothetical protein